MRCERRSVVIGGLANEGLFVHCGILAALGRPELAGLVDLAVRPRREDAAFRRRREVGRLLVAKDYATAAM